jgi:rhodanese-related sulfurtransferase
MRKLIIIYSIFACTVLIFAACLACAEEGITVIDKDQLKAELSKPNVAVIDVRATHDWDEAQFKIEGAQRQSPLEVAEWSGQYAKDKTIVLYCA